MSNSNSNSNCNFIRTFFELYSGTECHKNYLRWAALSALSVAAGPRYRLLNGTYYIYPVMYIIFVGSQGNRKTYAMSLIKKLMSEAFPDLPIGADITTRDDIIKFMSSDVTERAFTHQNGETDTYHPLALYISEFKDFTSYNPSMMINFVVNIFDYLDDVFKCSTIKRGAEDIYRPFLSILACENTEWFLKRLKEGVVTGGFSRRFNVIYEWGKPPHPVPRMQKHADFDILRNQLLSHLRNLHTKSIEYQWTKAGQEVFDKWYIKNFHTRQDDSSIAGFMSTKDQQLLKTCILLDLAEPKPTYLITPELVEEGLLWFDAIEGNLTKLYLSGGRNELAAEWVKILDLIEQHEGYMTEKEVRRTVGKDLGVRELEDSIKHLCDTDQMMKKTFAWPVGGAVKTYLISPKGVQNKELMSAMRAFNI